MAEHLPEDNLEDFLKKSFEGYREDPPDTLWSAIEAGMPVQTPVRPWHTSPYWYTAVAAALFGVAVSLHLCHNRQEVRWHPEHATVVTDVSGHADVVPATPAERPLATEQIRATAKKVREDQAYPDASTDRPAVHERAGAPPSWPAGPTPTPHGSAARSLAAGPGLPPTAASDTTFALVGPRENDNPYERTSPASRAAGAPAYASTTPPEVPEPLPTLAIGHYLVRTTDPRWMPTGGIRPVRNTKGTLHWQTMYLAVSENIRKVFPSRMPPISGQADKIFNNDRTANGTQVGTGLMLGIPVSRRLHFVTGLLYRRTTVEAAHEAVFRFKDRHGNTGGGTGDYEHVFSYDLNTASGPLEMDVRVSATDQSASIPENEELKFRVVTRRQDRQLSVPLLLQYRRPFGRLAWSASAGILLNTPLSTTYGPPDIATDNPRFMARNGRIFQDKYKQQPSISTHYYLSTGISLRLGPSLSLAFEPTLVGSIGNQQRAPFIEAGTMQAGLSTGLSYSF